MKADGRVTFDKDKILRTILTLCIAAAGGSVLGLLNLPAGWLTGGMIAVAIAALAKAPVQITNSLRNVAFVVIGSFLGSSVSPELLADLPKWPVSLAVLMLNLAVLQWAAQTFLHKVCRWDRQTAFFAAIPGLTSYVIALAMPTRADVSRIAVSQTIRVFLLVALLPKALTIVATPAGNAISAAVTSIPDMVITLAGGTLGGILFSFVGIPAGPLLGALLISGILHGFGIVQGGLPMPLLTAAYLVLGAVIGTRFAGTTLKALGAMFGASFGAFVISVGVAAIGAWIATQLTGLPLSQMVLAFSPGGIDVMTIMAFALGLDAAFVAGHQLARFLFIAIYAPIFVRKVRDANPNDDRA